VGYRSCFYRQISPGEGDIEANQPITLTFTETAKTFDPATGYGDAPDTTQL
jgi:phosphoribosyl-AMP cyclohydrolase